MAGPTSKLTLSIILFCIANCKFVFSQGLYNDSFNDLNTTLPLSRNLRPQAANDIPTSLRNGNHQLNSLTNSKNDTSEEDSSRISAQGSYHDMGIGAYYASWTPHIVNWQALDWVNYAFALPKADFSLDIPTPVDLTNLIAQANANGKKVYISIGGWGGSQYFSDAVTAKNSDVFAKNIIDMLNQFPAHGLDFDWEYPNSPSTSSSGEDDTQNFLLFLQKLKSLLPEYVQLAAAVQVWPFADISGVPITDASGFAQVLNKITIMSYDIFTASATPGPNAPLSSSCGGVGLYASVVASLKTWAAANFPVEKIVMGIAGYGYISVSNEKTLAHRDDHVNINSMALSDEGTDSGSITFRSMILQGILQRDSPTDFEAVNGWTRKWDECSSTPYLVSDSPPRVISYDDPESLRMKAQAVKEFGAAGVCSWTLQGDSVEGDLTNALRVGLGLGSV